MESRSTATFLQGPTRSRKLNLIHKANQLPLRIVEDSNNKTKYKDMVATAVVVKTVYSVIANSTKAMSIGHLSQGNNSLGNLIN